MKTYTQIYKNHLEIIGIESQNINKLHIPLVCFESSKPKNEILQPHHEDKTPNHEKLKPCSQTLKKTTKYYYYTINT
jgi:hypothetical protein